MSLKVDQAWADEYLKKKGGSSSPSPEKKRRDPPVLPESFPCADLHVPDMKEGDPCRRCGSGLPGRSVSIWVCDRCEAEVMKRIRNDPVRRAIKK